jgi:hypothetical protein
LSHTRLHESCMRTPSKVEPHNITRFMHANATHATRQAHSHLFYGLNRKILFILLFYLFKS